MALFKTGTFVEWTAEDEQGTFTHQGKVVDYSAAYAHIEISPNGSVIQIPHRDGTIKEIAQPKEWVLAKPPVEKEKPTSIKRTTTRTPKSTGESKKDKAVAIYKEMMDNGEHPARKDVIARFMTELDMTQAGASTYQNTCKKECSNA